MRRRTMLLLAIALVGAAAATTAEAQPVNPHFYVGPMVGYTFFRNAVGVEDNLYMGGKLGYQWLKWLGVEAVGGYTPTHPNGLSQTDVTFWHASGNLVFTPWVGRHVTPYAFGGGGYSNLKAKDAEDDVHFGTGEFGAGVRLWMNDLLGLVVEGRGIGSLPQKKWWEHSKLDQVVTTAKLTLAFGGGEPPDADGDGISDRRDKCPNTPKGATVDALGCPMDSDGDGVCDGLDKCPNTPKGAKVDAAGCPLDSDGDGVFDGLDKCPDTPKGATVDAAGCPLDSDGDGVYDGLDQCANTIKGCAVDEKGCPKDSDGDGVCDGLDKCPGTAAGLKVDADGCPIETIERETELLDTGMIRLEDINFETGKADVLPESYAALDVVGQVLSKWPELRIEVGGHTDSRGSAAFNQRLSEARSQAVLTYLTSKFTNLKPEQFSVKGYGESAPIVPNSGDLNMSKNRRVEFKVLNKETLKKEVERRKLLQK